MATKEIDQAVEDVFEVLKEMGDEWLAGLDEEELLYLNDRCCTRVAAPR